jgi:hypothetical protein
MARFARQRQLPAALSETFAKLNQSERQHSNLLDRKECRHNGWQVVLCTIVGFVCVVQSVSSHDASAGTESWVVQTDPPSLTVLYGWPLRFAGCTLTADTGREREFEPWTDWIFFSDRRWILPFGLITDLLVWLYMVCLVSWLSSRLRFRLRIIDLFGATLFAGFECCCRLDHVFRANVDLCNFALITLAIYARFATFFLVMVVCVASPRYLVSIFQFVLKRQSKQKHSLMKGTR